MPRVDTAQVPDGHRTRLAVHYRALRVAYLWREFECIFEDTVSGGVAWRHPASRKADHEVRHVNLLARGGFAVVSLPENFPGQPSRPPDCEVDGRVVQLRFRRLTQSLDPTVEMQRNVRSGRKTAPIVIYVVERGVDVNFARLDGVIDRVFGRDDLLTHALIYREVEGRLELLHERSRYDQPFKDKIAEADDQT